MTTKRLARTAERQELSDFVRHCRQQASPESFGLQATGRRRTSGLRREEVATLAGVGLTWYTWFEQGRAINVSDDFLSRLARGLRLDRAEREHLYALAGHVPLSRGEEQGGAPPAVVSMIRTLPDPAYVMNSRWDVLAFNDAAARLFPAMREDDPNMLRIVFFSARYREIVRDWRHSAKLMFLKARHDYLTGGRDPLLRCLLDRIMDDFPVARDWWREPEIVRIGNTEKELSQASGGWRRYDLSVLLYEGRPEIRIIVYARKDTDAVLMS
ncbi:helix-turn-helix transcriptional regulator [Stakelama sp. CBK3Z-3]|uniref:Helix-turn-helix transcriptional regulator n=1 Tax=Stakelama flava TaxID=2860338 RepID=A0ABS6XL07_9SPHN|nr:helix-turn-helix transcriptional regulator [Stakelama flava]MBW4330090.1 helix-turn-helix transcriptional regulator [Stakelama flava]